MAKRIKKGDPELLLVSFCDILTISISALFMATIITVFEATKVPELSMTPKSLSTDKQPVFFECRSNEVFAVDLGRLQDQVGEVLKSVDSGVRGGDMAQMIKVLGGRQITNEYYRVNANYLLTGMVALEPRPEAVGESLEKVNQANGKYQFILSQLNPNKQYVAFLVRDDSFVVFRRARELADKKGYDVGWELLGSDEPIKFGAGGANIKVGG
jgi:hypothetical protein